MNSYTRYALCLGAGLAFSSAHPAGVVASVGFPAFALNFEARRRSYVGAVMYHAGVSWPVIPAVRNFFGPDAGILDGAMLWATAALILALPWLLVWTRDRRQLLWRVPMALVVSAIPPLGLIGWASPIVAAGYLFPGTAWTGLLAVLLSAAGLAVFPKFALPAIILTSAVFNLGYRGPTNLAWAGVDTSFGGISHENSSAVKQFETAETIQRLALASSARVVVFPETVVPNWNHATDAFWAQSITSLRNRGKTIIVGSSIQGPDLQSDFSPQTIATTFPSWKAEYRRLTCAPHRLSIPA